MKTDVHAKAFTLIEIMVAIAIFFMAMFAILGVMSSGVHAASILRTSAPTAGMIAAQFTISNQMDEGSLSGNFGDVGIYDAYHWVSDCKEATTNGLFEMDFVVVDPNGVKSSSLSTMFYR